MNCFGNFGGDNGCLWILILLLISSIGDTPSKCPMHAIMMPKWQNSTIVSGWLFSQRYR